MDRPFAIILAVDRTGLYTQRKPAIKTRPFIALAVLVTSLVASAEGVAAEPTLALLPDPQEVAVGSGSITVPSLDSIQVRLARRRVFALSSDGISLCRNHVEQVEHVELFACSYMICMVNHSTLQLQLETPTL